MAHLVGTLLDANYNAAHSDHLHVEPETRKSGTPPHTNPGMTPGVKAIYTALNEEFGPGKYFLDGSGRYVGNDSGVYWTHMGGYNRRYIGGTRIWSQHAWWNALDIGPYVGIQAQQKFKDFLLNHTTQGGYNTLLTDKEELVVKQFAAALAEMKSNPFFVSSGNLIEDIRKDIITRDELEAALQGITQGTVDATARRLARSALGKLENIKEAI